jgi:WD repeat-containing protein 48
MPHPRRAMTASEDGVRAGAKDDYFSMRTRQTSAGAGNPSSPDEPPSASASAPATTPGAGLMGKFKSWRGTSKRTPSELGPLPTPGGTFITTSPSEVCSQFSRADAQVLNANMQDSTTRPSAIQLALHVLLSNPLTPPSTTDAPPLSLPPSTQITITEEAHPGWRTLYQGTLMHVAADMRALEEAMPIWLLEFLLVNKSPSIGVLKVGFVLVPYPAKNGDQLPELLNASQSKLTASRSLRVRKLLNHVRMHCFLLTPTLTSPQVQDKLEKMSQTPPHSPHNALPTGQTPRHTPKSTPRSSWGSHHGAKPKAEDLYEILCHDAVLPLDMTLAAVRQFVWRSSDELELHYRRKSPVLPVPPMPQRHS